MEWNHVLISNVSRHYFNGLSYVLFVTSSSWVLAESDVPTMTIIGYQPSSLPIVSFNPYSQTINHWSIQQAPQFADNNFSTLSLYTPNMQPDRLGSGTGEDYRLRGFNTGGRLLLDGILDNQSFYTRDRATYERVEIIKGHNSVLYGAGSPGGTVNFVSKKPRWIAQTDVSLALGNEGYRQLSFDSTGPINDKFAYRTVLSAYERDTWKQNVSESPITLLNALSWQNQLSQLTVSWEFSDHNYPYDFDNVYANGAPVFGVSYVHPASEAKHRYHRADIQFYHDWTNDWQLDAIYRYIQGTRQERQVGFFYLVSDDKPLVGFYQRVDETFHQHTAQVAVTKHSQWANKAQQTRLGISHHRTNAVGDNARAVGLFSLDIYQPDFSFTLPSTEQLIPRKTDLAWKENAWFIHHGIELMPNWYWAAGLRSSDYQLSNQRNQLILGENRNRHTSYASGLNWQASRDHQFRLSYSQSWLPNNGQSSTGDYFEPSRGAQWELGWQWRKLTYWFDMAVFDIRQDQLLMRDPQDPSARILAGENHTKGIELSGVLALTQQWQLYLMSSWLDSEMVKSDNYQGKQLPGVANHQQAAMLIYQPQPELQWTLGMVRQPKRWGDSDNTFKVDGYVRWDSEVRWRLKTNSELSASIQNITDKDYVSYIGGRDFARFGEPRTWRVTFLHHW